jgi:hypothetical protein
MSQENFITYEEFSKIPTSFLKTPKEVFEMDVESLTPQEKNFYNHYKKLFETITDLNTLRILRDYLDNEHILKTEKNRLEKIIEN